jgi:hypothetical protein
MQTDVFSDVLEPGEKIRAMLGAPRQSPPGEPRGWVQVGLTEHRVLIADVLRGGKNDELVIGERIAVLLESVSLERHPRTANSPARLELRGIEAPLVLVDMDRPDLFVQIRPFLAAWSGPVGGTGPIALLPESQWGARFQERRSRLRPGLLFGMVTGLVLGCAIHWTMG